MFWLAGSIKSRTKKRKWEQLPLHLPFKKSESPPSVTHLPRSRFADPASLTKWKDGSHPRLEWFSQQGGSPIERRPIDAPLSLPFSFQFIYHLAGASPSLKVMASFGNNEGVASWAGDTCSDARDRWASIDGERATFDRYWLHHFIIIHYFWFLPFHRLHFFDWNKKKEISATEGQKSCSTNE